MRDMHRARRGARRGFIDLALASAVALGTIGCGDTYITNGSSNPNGGGGSGNNGGGSGGNTGGPVTTTTVDVGTVNNAVDNGARATVDLNNTNQQQQGQAQVAQQVTLDKTQTDKDESVQGAIADLDDLRDDLRLDVLGVIVSFDDKTQFVDTSGQQVTLAVFVAFVKSELAAGRKPGVECTRKAKKPAQAPRDATFVAVTIVLQPTTPQPVIDCNIDRDHVTEANGQVVIVVLDVVIVLQNGQTVLVFPAGTTGSTTPTCGVKVAGLVATVDLTQGRVQLADGTVVMVATTTHVLAMGEDDGDSDHEDEMEGTRLTTLNDVTSAIAAGRRVEAESQGCTQVVGPPATYAATQVAFEVGG